MTILNTAPPLSRRGGTDRIETLTLLPLLGLALWTLLAHGIGLFGQGNFHDLTRWAWIPLVATPPLWLALRNRTRHTPLPSPVPAPHPPRPVDWTSLTLAAALVALFEFALHPFPNGRIHLFWMVAMLFLGHAWWTMRDQPGVEPAPPAPLRRAEAWLFALLVIAAVAITAMAHRPDPDDQYYSNLAAMTLDHPDRPLLSWNQMVWAETELRWMPVDRVPSVELLVALLASLLDREPIWVSHLLLAPLYAAWVVLAQTLLLRHLAPNHWLAALPITLGLLLLAGGEFRASPAVFAFVQLQFGKSLLFSALLPVLLWSGLRFAQTGRTRDAAWIFLGQIAAVGCSSSGIFLGPVATGLGLAANWRPNRIATLRALLGVLACAYPLGLGLSMRHATVDAMVNTAWQMPDMAQSIHYVFGKGPHLWFYLLVLTGAWATLSDPRLRRTLLGLSCVFIGLVFNPLLHPLLTEHLTGPVTWRLFLTMPMPLLGALLLHAIALPRPESQPGATPRIPAMESRLPVVITLICAGTILLSFLPRWRGWWGDPFAPTIALVGLALIVRFIPRFRFGVGVLALITLLATLAHLTTDGQGRRPPLTPPRTRIERPDIKAPRLEFELALAVVGQTPPDHSALVPRALGVWVTTRRHHPRLVAVERSYMNQLADFLTSEEREGRLELLDYVEGNKQPVKGKEKLTAAIDDLRIGLVVIQGTTPWRAEIEEILGARGFEPSEREGYRFWIRRHERP
ncbi:hypothetical protein SIID45300_01988 [Candidatus Magnetaquicoccaceae bacterium FCR-1]|uniref:Glycosyltransferase RgtA/B/C/D-like domain-containing protein n=1 Tax=Candidatus Magnetaquiglobus chichijimensis TaxID=3141448 RepID=A0ABQ0C9U3_9PROT